MEGPLSGTENASRESEMGQPEKGSRRAYVFRIASDSCRKRALPALTFSATSSHSLIRSRTAGIDPTKSLGIRVGSPESSHSQARVFNSGLFRSGGRRVQIGCLSVATTQPPISPAWKDGLNFDDLGRRPGNGKKLLQVGEFLWSGTSPYRASPSTALFAFATALAANRGMFIPSARTVCTSTMPMKPRI